jgi:hypothetical protein
MKTTVSIGATTIFGWITAVVGILPLVFKSVEEGQIAFHGPEKWLAIAGVVSLAITQIGRYLQSIHLIKVGAGGAAK